MTKPQRIFTVGDIHGCKSELDEMLDWILPQLSNQYYDNKLIFLGDYVDRGPNVPGVINRLMDLQETRDDVICLKGNHDSMLADHLDPTYGLMTTFTQYNYVVPESHLSWLRSLPVYHETEHHWFVHGGIESLNGHPKDETPESLMWARRTESIDRQKILVVGHTPNSDEFARVWRGQDNKIVGINVDGGCCFGGNLQCVVLVEREVVGNFRVQGTAYA